MNSISVAVIDDHPLMVEAISDLLQPRPWRFKVVGVGTSANDIVELCERNKPQIAVVDLHMPGGTFTQRWQMPSRYRLRPNSRVYCRDRR